MNGIEQSFLRAAHKFLSRLPVCGYYPDTSPATESTSLAALALLGLRDHSSAQVSLDWLASQQQSNGSLGVRPNEPQPNWPTALAVIAWSASQHFEDNFGQSSTSKTSRTNRDYRRNIEKAVEFILKCRGVICERDKQVEHDTTLAAWPWVEGTHSWIEPTAFNVMALGAAGLHDHPRRIEGQKMLVDRQLPHGGCNYGNRIVNGQELRPHVQPTGIATLALHDCPDEVGHIANSVKWLVDAVDERTTAVSLSWALLGLAAHDQWTPEMRRFVEAAWNRETRRRASPHKIALLVLAALGSRSTLLPLPQPTNGSPNHVANTG